MFFKPAVLMGGIVLLSGCFANRVDAPETISGEGLTAGITSTQLIRETDTGIAGPGSNDVNADAAPLAIAQAQLGECYLRLGQCKTTVDIDGASVPILVQTGHQNGLFYQIIRADRGQRSFKKYSLLMQSVFAIDGFGAITEMNSISYLSGDPVEVMADQPI